VTTGAIVRVDCSTQYYKHRFCADDFLATTHRDISNPEGMPNARLLDRQIRQVAADLLSLRKQP
jgi:hypothetical protein